MLDTHNMTIVTDYMVDILNNYYKYKISKHLIDFEYQDINMILNDISMVCEDDGFVTVGCLYYPIDASYDKDYNHIINEYTNELELPPYRAGYGVDDDILALDSLYWFDSITCVYSDSIKIAIELTIIEANRL